MNDNPEIQLDKILTVIGQIPFDGKISLLTGQNGSGKSLIRNQLIFYLKEKVSPEAKVIQTSMELRTGSNPSLGALSGFARDIAWLPTSALTIKSIQNTWKAVNSTENGYYIVDEPELGCGEETQLALVNLLNEIFAQPTQKLAGIMVITHSRVIASRLKHDHFYNLDDYSTLEEWLNRPLVATNLALLEENKLYHYIRDHKNSE